MQPRIVVQQKLTAFVNKYKVFSADDKGEAGNLVAFAQQKRFKIKEQFPFYSDESKQNLSFSFGAEKVFDIHGRYMVKGKNDEVLGGFKKMFKKSLAVSTWVIYDQNNNELFTVKESSLTIALLRRFAGFIPLVGDFIELIMPLFRYHFDFMDAKGEKVGRYEKTKLFRDHYVLAMSDEAWQACDWRVYSALAVGLDALQSR